jgi:hypothetical protein
MTRLSKKDDVRFTAREKDNNWPCDQMELLDSSNDQNEGAQTNSGQHKQIYIFVNNLLIIAVYIYIYI